MKNVSSPERSQHCVFAFFGWLGSQSSSFQVADDLFSLQFSSYQCLGILMRNSELFRTDIRGQKLFLTNSYFDRLDLELLSAIFRERPNQSIETDVGFGSIEGSYFNENVFGIDRNLTVLSIDDRRYRTNDVVTIHDQRIYRTVSDQMQILFQFVVFK